MRQAAALLADLEALRDLPAVPFEACEHVPGQISSTALVRYRLVDYSAPAAHAHKKVMVKGYVDRVEIALGAEIVARHRRSYVRGDVVYDPLHYLSLLEKKPGALDQAAPLRGWKLDPAFDTLRRLPPMDYADKLPPSPWYIFAPPRRYIFPPPLTPERAWREPHKASASADIISFKDSRPAKRQKRSTLMRRSSKASGIDGKSRQDGSEERSLRVVLVMASFSLMESAPRA